MAAAQTKNPSLSPVGPSSNQLGDSEAASAQLDCLDCLENHLLLLSSREFLTSPTLEPSILLSQRTRSLPGKIRRVSAKQHSRWLANCRIEQFPLLFQGGVCQ